MIFTVHTGRPNFRVLHHENALRALDQRCLVLVGLAFGVFTNFGVNFAIVRGDTLSEVRFRPVREVPPTPEFPMKSADARSLLRVFQSVREGFFSTGSSELSSLRSIFSHHRLIGLKSITSWSIISRSSSGEKFRSSR